MDYGLRESWVTNFCWLGQFWWVGLDDFWFYICCFWSMIAWWESWHLGLGGLHTYVIYLNLTKKYITWCLDAWGWACCQWERSEYNMWIAYISLFLVFPMLCWRNGVCMCRTTTLLSGRILCTISLNLVHWSAGVWAATTHLLLVDMPRASFQW